MFRGNLYFCQLMELNLPKLNFPAYSARFKRLDAKNFILDPIRQKYVPLTPEEWVRQHLISYFFTYKGVPKGLMSVEVSFSVNGVNHRADVVVFNRNGEPLLVVECKAPDVEVGAKTVEQVARYNSFFKSPFLAVTNGLVHYAFAIDWNKKEFRQLEQIPDYNQMINGIE